MEEVPAVNKVVFGLPTEPGNRFAPIPPLSNRRQKVERK